MFVDTELLRAGGREARRAGAHTEQAAQHLSREPLPARMFGDFGAGEAFRLTVGAAHAYHLRTLLGNRVILSGVGDHAEQAATAFRVTEDDNAGQLRAVRCDSGT
ncbi:DUF2563 family protein [Mycobacterium asiaticum]|uniref:Uncharacterized protein n=1 Tax=Mycobacterium asiaticum TaxID=1790 RepID=A0A1A3CV72_MYCAS|nr:DUF2563 family protein [Mycobacterium asiaticum]OBI90247.1 hypothetical protein A9X01_12160 [Mycobacterium asiaticum]